jgi:hypothetical protein
MHSVHIALLWPKQHSQLTKQLTTPHHSLTCLGLLCVCVQAPYQQLSHKLATLIRECFAMHTFHDISKKLSRFQPCLRNAAAQMLLKRGRR